MVKIRLFINKDQKHILTKTFGSVRFIYNYILNIKWIKLFYINSQIKSQMGIK